MRVMWLWAYLWETYLRCILLICFRLRLYSHICGHLQQSPFFFFPPLASCDCRTEPLVVELDSSFCLPPFVCPLWCAWAFAYLSLIAFDMWKNVSFTLWPVLALVSKNAMPNSLARAIPCSVSITFLSVKSALFPIRTFSTF